MSCQFMGIVKTAIGFPAWSSFMWRLLDGKTQIYPATSNCWFSPCHHEDIIPHEDKNPWDLRLNEDLTEKCREVQPFSQQRRGFSHQKMVSGRQTKKEINKQTGRQTDLKILRNKHSVAEALVFMVASLPKRWFLNHLSTQVFHPVSLNIILSIPAEAKTDRWSKLS